MCEEKYIANCTATQEEWKKRHEEKGLRKFIYDGVVNQMLWEQSEKKIMFFLKEAYIKGDDSEGNLCDLLNEWEVWKMWKVVSDWVYALHNVTSYTIPAYHSFDYSDSKKSSERVRSISVVNIKKSEGETTSNFDDLMKYIEFDNDLIRRQIAEISPEIILCGNTGYYFEVVYGAKLDKKNNIKSNAIYNGYEIKHSDFNTKGYYWAGNTLIINYCHPANHFNRQGKYYALAALYQQALKEKERK